jgi:hypothetical protein
VDGSYINEGWSDNETGGNMPTWTATINSGEISSADGYGPQRAIDGTGAGQPYFGWVVNGAYAKYGTFFVPSYDAPPRNDYRGVANGFGSPLTPIPSLYIHPNAKVKINAVQIGHASVQGHKLVYPIGQVWSLGRQLYWFERCDSSGTGLSRFLTIACDPPYVGEAFQWGEAHTARTAIGSQPIIDGTAGEVIGIRIQEWAQVTWPMSAVTPDGQAPICLPNIRFVYVWYNIWEYKSTTVYLIDPARPGGTW